MHWQSSTMFGVVIVLYQICAIVGVSIVRQHFRYWRPPDEEGEGEAEAGKRIAMPQM